MESLDKLELYLRAQLSMLRSAEQLAAPPQVHPFVTISRQAGAGGHSLAQAMLDVFARQDDTTMFGEWQVFDQKLCEMVASDPMFSDSLDSLLTEEYRRPANDLFHQVLRSTIDQDIVMAHVFELVRALASIGKAIIVGRAGSEVTKGLGPGVHLRVVAPESQRVARLMELYSITKKQAHAEMRRLDAGRSRLLRTHFNVDIDDACEYDAVWNTGSASLDEIAGTTATLLRHRVAAWQPT